MDGWMLCFTLLTLLYCAFTSAEVNQARSSSFSGEFGGGGGKRFSHSGNQLDGPITAIRIRVTRSYITGIQVRYGREWSEYQGGSAGDLEEIFLQPGESIIQVQGKFNSYVSRLLFVTDRGRYFPFGMGRGISFNAVPLFPGTVLRYISGSSGSIIDAISFHWDNKPTGITISLG
ncbi:zymogen granule membrane protein 16-like [Anolis sagrei]|uniref:zymogen granule membrane protein 16-like n=1 Tax=Anolis sagrei TaxID=38937 RepID=UPI00351FB7A2